MKHPVLFNLGPDRVTTNGLYCVVLCLGLLGVFITHIEAIGDAVPAHVGQFSGIWHFLSVRFTVKVSRLTSLSKNKIWQSEYHYNTVNTTLKAAELFRSPYFFGPKD